MNTNRCVVILVHPAEATDELHVVLCLDPTHFASAGWTGITFVCPPRQNIKDMVTTKR